jgi:hypothetical protein
MRSPLGTGCPPGTPGLDERYARQVVDATMRALGAESSGRAGARRIAAVLPGGPRSLASSRRNSGAGSAPASSFGESGFIVLSMLGQ